MIINYIAGKITLPEQFKKTPQIREDFGPELTGKINPDTGTASFMWGDAGITIKAFGEGYNPYMGKVMAIAKHDLEGTARLPTTTTLLRLADEIASHGNIEDNSIYYFKLISFKGVGESRRTSGREFQVEDDYAVGSGQRLFTRVERLKGAPKDVLLPKYAHLPEMAEYIRGGIPMKPAIRGKTLQEALSHAISIWAMGEDLKILV